MNGHNDEDRPSFGDRLLDKLSDTMKRTLHHLWHHHGREAHDAEAGKRLDGYGKAYDGPMRKMLDTVEQRTREGGPGWREPLLPGLKPGNGELEYSREKAGFVADEQRRREEFDEGRARLSRPPMHEDGGYPDIRRSIWAQDMREAEDMALKAAAVENTHDHTQGRDR